uniref:Small ribosomal subunit protein uS19c n=1 Tax=Cyanophora paradoxa TaxID=2762 RepID=E9P1E1_CYAPA|nr:ribosomal protein S19 [Cyanophora paradoxa]ADW79193.1 ribosomal protein S19 [Cyanophora paradoxa]
MSRSSWKGQFLNTSILKVIQYNKIIKNYISRTWSRDLTITHDLVNYKLGVYNGKKFTQVFISENMVGHKLGEFCLTKLPCNHKKNKKNLRKWAKK